MFDSKFVTVTLVSAALFLIFSKSERMIAFIDSKQKSDALQANLAKNTAFEWIYEENFFERPALDTLEKMIRSNKIAVILEDTSVEDVASAPVGHPDCKRSFMTISKNGSMCVFPHRIDVALNYFKIGGFSGIMESFEKMSSRLISFRHKLLHMYTNEQLEQIYGTKFLNKAKQLCMKNSLVEFDESRLETDLFQFDVIVVLPGQELPMHLDIPYFWGADRKSLPHWLLAIMKRSQLFDDKFIPQVQGVAWLSKHQYKKDEKTSSENSGNFYFYPVTNETGQNAYVLAKAEYNSAILVDGTQVVHGVERFKPRVKPPALEKDAKYFLVHGSKDDKWDLVDVNNNVIGSYPHEDVRISLVWRVHCFKDKQEIEKYKNQKERMPLEDVLNVFKSDLKKRKNYQNLDEMNKIDFYKLLVDEYSTYPNNKYNTLYSNLCLINTLLPSSLNTIINPIINFLC